MRPFWKEPPGTNTLESAPHCLALVINFRLCRKSRKTLAYFGGAFVTKRVFTTLIPGACIIKLNMAVLYGFPF
jgi:hypothetical protein